MFIAPRFKPSLVTAALSTFIVAEPVNGCESDVPPTPTFKKSVPSSPVVGSIVVTPYDAPVVSVNLPSYDNVTVGFVPVIETEFPLDAFDKVPPLPVTETIGI